MLWPSSVYLKSEFDGRFDHRLETLEILVRERHARFIFDIRDLRFEGLSGGGSGNDEKGGSKGAMLHAASMA